MTVEGHNIVLNCRACFNTHGYGVELVQKGGLYVCRQDPMHQYVLKNGFTHSAGDSSMLR